MSAAAQAIYSQPLKANFQGTFFTVNLKHWLDFWEPFEMVNKIRQGAENF